MRAAPALLLFAVVGAVLLSTGCGSSHRQVYYPLDEAPFAEAGPWTTRVMFVRKTPRELVLQVRVENNGDRALVLAGGARVFRLRIAEQILMPDTLERTSWTLWGGTIARESDVVRGGDLTLAPRAAKEFELRWTFAVQLPGDDLPWVLSAPIRSVDGSQELLLAVSYPVAEHPRPIQRTGSSTIPVRR